ncbi:MAG: heme-copper oxidase subunit III [Microbacteriaceae bacterium]
MTSAALTSHPSKPFVNRPNPLSVGLIVWLGSEVLFFAGLFSIYFSLRSVNPELWHHHLVENGILNVPFAFVNTTVLVLSSVTAQFGVFAAERMQPRRTGWKLSQWGMIEWFILTFILGATFVSGQVYEYAALVGHGLSLNTDPYSAGFYITTGFHAIHVTGGLIAFLLIIGRAYAAKKFGHFEANGAIAASYYWHFVDVVWVALFIVIYFLQ